MTIKVYATVLAGDPIETHEWAGTFGEFLSSKGIEYEGGEDKLAVLVNGRTLSNNEWSSLRLDAHDDVSVVIKQNGGLLSGIGNILGKLFGALFGWLMPSVGDNGRNDPGQGRRLDPNSAKANQVKMGDVVPEIAGRVKRFPDYLTPPRRYFVNRREQWLEFMACVGVGKYQILSSDIKVGDTPFLELGADAEYGVYFPGTDLSGIEAHNHWHTVEEVGGTSSGTAGLELSTEMENRHNTDPASYTFSGSTIGRSDGEFPTGWGNGTIVSITMPLSYVVTITSPPLPFQPINIFTGNFLHCLPFVAYPNQIIKMNGVEYRVFDYDIDGNGDGWVQLYTMGDPSPPVGPPIDPEPVNDIPPGTYTYDFSVDSGYVINQMSETQIIVTRQPSAGWLGFAPGVVPSAITFIGGTVYGEWTSAYVGCPGNETTSEMEIDVFFPGGLCYLDDGGNVLAQSVGIEIQYWDSVNLGTKITLTNYYTDATLDQIGVTERISISTMNPSVRVRRIGASSTETNIQDKVHWYGYKTKLRTRSSYPEWTTMLARLRSGGKIAAQSENQINIIATRVLPTMQPAGHFGGEAATRDISAFFRYQALSAGYTDDDIDLVELKRLHDLWTARGDYFDFIFTSTTAQDAMNKVLNAGFAELSVSDGLLRPVRDELRGQFEQAYGPFNMKGPLRRQFKARKSDDFDGVEVEYMDAETWTTNTLRCLLPGDLGIKMEKIKADGVTDRTRAWRMGMRRRRAQKYRIWEYKFSTEMSALNSDYMSYVPLFDDVPGYGKTSMLVGIRQLPSGQSELELSEPMPWAQGGNIIAYRSLQGVLVGPFPATRGATDRHALAFLPDPKPTVNLGAELIQMYFGTSENFCFPALITAIAPRGTTEANVTAINYDPRIYADDNNAPTQ